MPIIVHFCPVCIKFSSRYVLKNLMSKYEFLENSALLTWVPWLSLYPHFPRLVLSLGDLRIMFLTICNLHDDGLRAGRPVLCEYIELLWSLYPETVWQFESKERDGNASVLRHRVEHLQYYLILYLRNYWLVYSVIKQGCQSLYNAISKSQTFISDQNVLSV